MPGVVTPVRRSRAQVGDDRTDEDDVERGSPDHRVDGGSRGRKRVRLSQAHDDGLQSDAESGYEVILIVLLSARSR